VIEVCGWSTPGPGNLTADKQTLYTSVSQQPGRGPVPGRGINYTGPQEA